MSFWKVPLLLAVALSVACGSSLRVSSTPAGAKIFIDGKDTGSKTPDSFRGRVIPSGRRHVTVQLEGYETPHDQIVETHFSFGKFFWSFWLPPIFIVNIFRGWSSVNPGTMHFVLKPNGQGGGTSSPGTSTYNPPPRRRDGTIERFEGQRAQINQKGLKCAALPMQTKDVSEAMLLVLDEILLTELMQAGFDPIGKEDLSALVDFESQKDHLACDDASCMVELGNALGVPYLVSGKLARIGSDTVMTLKLIDVRKARVLARANRIVGGGDETIPRLLGEAVQDLIKGSKL